MSDRTTPGVPSRSAGDVPPAGRTSRRGVVLTLLLMVMAVWAIWTSVSVLGYAIDTCLIGSGQNAGSVTPTTGPSPDLTLAPSASPGPQAASATPTTDRCMSDNVTLALTSITFNDLPFDLLLVRMPWAAGDGPALAPLPGEV